MSIARAIRSVGLDRAYASLPKLDCQRKCQESCGPIVFAGEERRRLEERVNFGQLPPLQEDGACGFLRAGGCAVYALRPMVCRLWGLTQSMACPFGCVPERWLTDQEAHALLDKAQEW